MLTLSSKKVSDAVLPDTIVASAANLFLAVGDPKLVNGKFGKNIFGSSKLNPSFEKGFRLAERNWIDLLTITKLCRRFTNLDRR